MNLNILVITYVFTQLLPCTLSDISAENFVQTNPTVSTSASPALDSEYGIEASSNPPLVAETNDSSQDRYDATTFSNLRSTTSAKITWNSVSSIILSTDSPPKSSSYANTLPSIALQNITQPSESIASETPPSIFENLDHEENELDSDTRVTDLSKGLKTTLYTDLPLLYSHKETVSSEGPTDNPSISHLSADHSLSEKESIYETTAEHNISSSEKIENFTEISLLSDHTSFSDSTTQFSNTELFTDNKETSSVLTRDETVTPDSNLFVSLKSTSEISDINNTRETENMEHSTFISDSTKFLYDEDSKSTESSNTELNAENREEESNLYYSILNLNATSTESSKDLESVETFSFSEKSAKGLQPTSTLNLETTPASALFDLSEKSNDMLTSTTKMVFKTIVTDNSTTGGFSTTVSDSLPLDNSPSTRIPPYTSSVFFDKSFSQTFSDLQENHTSTILEDITSHSSFTIPIHLTDQENLSTSTLTSNKPPATIDESTTPVPEIVVSSDFHLNTTTVFTESIEPKESQTVSASTSEDIKMEETTESSVNSTEHDDTNKTTISSLQRNDPTKYDTSNIEKETSVFSTSVKPTLSGITTSFSSLINTLEDNSKLLTTTELYFPSSNIPLSTMTPNNIEESNTVTHLPFHKHVDTESTIGSSTKQNTIPQTIPYYWFLSTKIESTTNISSDVESKYSTVALSSHEDTYRETSTDVSTEQNIVAQTVSHYPISSTNFEQSPNFVTDNVFSSLKPIQDLSTEETTTSKFESYTVIDETPTSLSDSYSNSPSIVPTDVSTMSPETHREGKHIPFSSASTVRVTDLSSEYGFLLVTTDKTSVIKAAVNDTEVHYKQMKFEEINPIDRTNIITAVIQFPADSVHKMDMKVKLARTHNWLDKVLTKEFRNWTGDPFQDDEEQKDEIPFGNISIFYVKPTPETNASHITLTFIVYNAWRNRTLPVDFVPGTLNFYSKELKESINASAVYFYHGLSTDTYDLLSAVFDKYGIIIFTICIAIVGITVLVCVVVFYRKKTRQSIHYLADSKLQQNLQEAVGIDLTPASIILQDEKEEKGNKICDDEGWLVPITDVPVAEDNNVPNIQDTKL